MKVDADINRNQQKPEQTQEIGNGKYFFFPVLDIHGMFLQKQYKEKG
jgi:hypothetical protein